MDPKPTELMSASDCACATDLAAAGGGVAVVGVAVTVTAGAAAGRRVLVEARGALLQHKHGVNENKTTWRHSE